MKNKYLKLGLSVISLICVTVLTGAAQEKVLKNDNPLNKNDAHPAFRILVVASADPDHDPMIKRAEPWLKKIGFENNFLVTYTRDANYINDDTLSAYQVFVQMHLAPFDMTSSQQESLQRFVTAGKGWVGIHAAGLTGTQFLGKDAKYWTWFQKLMGDIVYSPHPAKQSGIVVVEDKNHPVTKNLPSSFRFFDEWYEFDRSPRPNVHVLATADESSYHQEKPMGDHPMIWTNPSFDRAVYIGIGHDTSACSDNNFTILVRDAILWASVKPPSKPEGPTSFNALILTERGGQHEGFVVAALDWLKKFGARYNVGIREINNANAIREKMLSDYKVIIQLDYPPYRWDDQAERAFERYIEEGRGGWVGFHHATLLGEFDGYPMWQWFSDFMGGIRFENYVAATVSGKVNIEDVKHPVTKGVSHSFVVKDEEWYTFNRNPRENVHVLASVDESTYSPSTEIKMGDHPVIWTNISKKARNVYILMGHDGSLIRNKDFTALMENAILWAAE